MPCRIDAGAHARHHERPVRQPLHVVFARPWSPAPACRWPSTPVPLRPQLPRSVCARRPKPPPRNAVCTFTFAGSTPSAFATASRSGDCICVPRYRSQPSARTSARQLSGSIGECARYGSSYSTSMRLAALRQRRRARRPLLRATSPGLLAAAAWYSAAQRRGREAAIRAFVPFDLQRLAAALRGPGVGGVDGDAARESPSRRRRRRTARAAVSSIFAIFAPITGGRAITANNMPGTRMSMPNFALPSTFIGAVEPLLRLAEIAELRRILERDLLRHRQRRRGIRRACRTSASSSR